jgi:hypothetical protein
LGGIVVNVILDVDSVLTVIDQIATFVTRQLILVSHVRSVGLTAHEVLLYPPSILLNILILICNRKLLLNYIFILTVIIILAVIIIVIIIIVVICLIIVLAHDVLLTWCLIVLVYLITHLSTLAVNIQ